MKVTKISSQSVSLSDFAAAKSFRICAISKWCGTLINQKRINFCPSSLDSDRPRSLNSHAPSHTKEAVRSHFAAALTVQPGGELLVFRREPSPNAHTPATQHLAFPELMS